MNHKSILFSGAVFMAMGVLVGAFGAHGLKSQLSADMMQVYKTGTEYLFYNAIGLMIIGLTGFHIHSGWLLRAGILIILGIFLFSGSLFILAITGIKYLGIITPVGGVSFIAGWIFFAISLVKNRSVPGRN
jgi:uncharacterized membrane protein YgdD (TMEM256/DUF423 family)